MSSYKFNRKCFKNYLGGYDGGQPIGVGDSDNSDEILEYDLLTGRWNLVDRMIQARSNHAVAVINFEPELCSKIISGKTDSKINYYEIDIYLL